LKTQTNGAIHGTSLIKTSQKKEGKNMETKHKT
jgi:hypothetical protein